MSRVAILTPAYNYHVTIPYVTSLVPTFQTLRDDGHEPLWFCNGNVGSIPKMRNALVADALHNNADELIFIDSDIGWHPTAIQRLLQHDTDLVAVAPKTNKPIHGFDYAIAFKDNTLEVTDGIAEVDGMPTAFMRIRAEAIRELQLENPHLQYWTENVPGADKYLYALFDYLLDDDNPAQPEMKRYLSEDYGFCHHWRKSGRRVYCDPYIPLDHYKSVTLNGKLIDALKPE